MLMRDSLAPQDLGTVLRSRLTGFAGFLQANGYGVGAADSVDILETATRIGALDPRTLRWSLQGLLCGCREEWSRFDALFDAYFLPPNKQAFVGGGAGAAQRTPAAARGDDCAEAAPGTTQQAEDDAHGVRHGASCEALLAATDFSELTRATEAREMEALMRRFARRMKRLCTRRELHAAHGHRLDVQSTIRRSVASGGTPVELAWQARRRVRPRLLLLMDVSRSMGLYSFFYLRLARALCQALADAHSFIFHTHMTPVSEALRDPDPWRAQERLQVLAVGWAGGTRIGECLEQFNREFAARLVHSRSGIIIVSDGYDTGEPARLARALAKLQRRARRIVWLHPLLGQPGFQLEAAGMRAALPHLDLLAPGANLAAIEQLLPRLIGALQ